MATVTFLGTGNYLAPGRYWNSFVVDRTILVEPSPAALPNLRIAGLSARDIEVVMVSHFHCDHTFGWPFLLLELLTLRAGKPLAVVGPPGIEKYLRDMVYLGAVPHIHEAAKARMEMTYVEADGTWQEAGPLRFRAIEVEHDPALRCFGYALDRGDRTIGYSGDTKSCAGLDELAGMCDALVLECNGPHPPAAAHMDIGAVRKLRDKFPTVPFVLTHMGEGVTSEGMPDVYVPDDFETLSL